jgi:CRISPR-associated protein Csd1
VSDERAEAGSQGFCQVTGQFGPLPTSHATKLGGVPGGIASGVSLVSYDKDAFESYGLDKAVNAGIGYRAADGCTRALTALLTNKLPDRPKTSFRLGGVVFLCWTRTPKDAIDHESIYAPTPERVVKLLTSAIAGKQHYGVRARDFYCLALSGNAARAIVRSYLELPIGEVQRHLAAWFRDLSIVGDFTGEVVNAFALSTLVEMTVRSGDDPPPDLSNAMVTAALTESPLPQSVLAACLRRIRVEAGAAQFSPARMGLIKLVVNRLPGTGDFKMTASLDPVAEQQSPGYACGRLLACLARCQSPKDFGASAQILERFFGSASAAPRAVFPILLRLNRHHIRKIRDELPGFAYNLEQDLEERLAPFRKPLGQNPDFPATLSLPDQGRFALGFYHQRADFRAASKERKAAELSSVDTE